MEQRQRPAQRPRLTREELAARRRRRRLRLVRNWVLFLSGCGALVGVMTGLLLWAMPQLSGLVAGRQEFAAPSYDLSGYLFDPDDPYLVLVNGQLPMSENDQTAPALAAADEAGGILLEAAAAAAWREMAAAAAGVDIHLRLVSGYMDADAQAAAFDARVQRCLKQGLGQADAEARAAAVVPRPGCNEAGTGLAADILAEGYTRLDTGFADTDAYRWLCAYAADYGFILRWPEDSQAVTGMVFQPWHWRYVGVENARAIRASGQCLEAFLALRRADLS